MKASYDKMTDDCINDRNLTKALSAADLSKAKVENKWNDATFSTVLGGIVALEKPLDHLNKQLGCVMQICKAKEERRGEGEMSRESLMATSVLAHLSMPSRAFHAWIHADSSASFSTARACDRRPRWRRRSSRPRAEWRRLALMQAREAVSSRAETRSIERITASLGGYGIRSVHRLYDMNTWH